MPPHSPADTVKTRWLRLAAALALPAGIATVAWSELETAYMDPHRHYHTLTHIDAALCSLDRHRCHFDDPETAELALFFHDLVYNPARQDNESQSANRLRELLTGHVNERRLARAAAHIQATRLHNATQDADTNLLLDIDMSILGAPWPDYLAYAKGVYAEYVPVYGTEAYAAGRAKLFLEPTLAKETIFLTDTFAASDHIARQNLRTELDLWQTGRFGV